MKFIQLIAVEPSILTPWFLITTCTGLGLGLGLELEVAGVTSVSLGSPGATLSVWSSSQGQLGLLAFLLLACPAPPACLPVPLWGPDMGSPFPLLQGGGLFEHV